MQKEIQKIFPQSKIYLKWYNPMLMKVELRGYNNKLIWKTNQKNLLYPDQMYDNKQKALNELKESLYKFKGPEGSRALLDK